jgi:hypothetical protein
MDLANNRLRSIFILPIQLANTVRADIVANFPPARRYICIMVTGRPRTAWSVRGMDPKGAFRC